jgi:chaperonin cofactor prefoldin
MMHRVSTRHPAQMTHLERLMKEAAKVSREIEAVQKAVEVAGAVGSFEAQRLLERARDHLQDAFLEIREAQRVFVKNGASAPSS